MLKIFKITGLLSIILMCTVLLLFLLKPRIPLGALSSPVSALFTYLTGYEQVVSGRFYLVPGSWATFSVEECAVALAGSDGVYLKADLRSAEGSIHLWSLLAGELSLDNMRANGGDLEIHPVKIKSADNKEEVKEFHGKNLRFNFQQTGEFELSDISITIRQAPSLPPIKLELEKGGGQFNSDSPGLLKIQAVLNGRPFTTEFDSGPLRNLGEPDTIWPFALRIAHKSVLFAINGSVDGEKPPYAIKIQSDRLDIDELKSFIWSEETSSSEHKGVVGNVKIDSNDILFPSIFPTLQLALELTLKELVIGGKTIRDVRLNSRIEDGIIKNSPFAATFRNASLSGNYSLDFTGDEPKISAHLNSTSLNIGAILEELQLGEKIGLELDTVKTDLDTSGRTLVELVNNLGFSIYGEGGRFEYTDLNTGATQPVSLHSVKINGVPSDLITLEALGEIDDTPIHLSMEIDDRRGEVLASIKDVSFRQVIRIAGTQLELAGKIILPYTGTGLSLECRLGGEQLSNLNELLNLQLPDIGPYSIDGIISVISEGYRLDGLDFQVGSSRLGGNIFLNTKTVPPAVAVDLQARNIQLDDFKEMWLGTRDEDDGKQIDQQAKKIDTSEQEQHLITDQRVLDSYDATVSVKVKEVYSGADYLGTGLLKIEQQQGIFRVAPLQINFNEGFVGVDFTIKPAGENRRFLLDVTVDDLNYGFVGRWFKPDSEMAGIFSLHGSLESESQDFKSIMANGSGSIIFLVQPERLQAGVIDMWAVNLLNYVTSIDAPKGGSHINCAAGRFTLRDGLLSRDELLIDTSRIQVFGNLNVDFHRNWIEGRLRPRAKRPQFLSLATPIQISGPLSDLDAGVATGGGVGTLIRLATDFIAVPLQWIVLDKLPKDGTADCLKIIEYENQKEGGFGHDWYSSP